MTYDPENPFDTGYGPDSDTRIDGPGNETEAGRAEREAQEAADREHIPEQPPKEPPVPW